TVSSTSTDLSSPHDDSPPSPLLSNTLTLVIREATSDARLYTPFGADCNGIPRTTN
ncbi:hypothetical protein RRG08_057555, partial [Elysia crispata]